MKMWRRNRGAQQSCLYVRNPAVNRRMELAAPALVSLPRHYRNPLTRALAPANELAAGPAVNHNYHRVRFYSNGNSLGSLDAL